MGLRPFPSSTASSRTRWAARHGEAVVRWSRRAPAFDERHHVLLLPDLPKTQYKIERAVTLKAGEATVDVEEWIENLAPYDRPYNRNQHATFGAPFVTPGRNVLDMSGTRGMTDPNRTAAGKWAGGRLFQWPDAPPLNDGVGLSLRDFHAIPAVRFTRLTERSLKPRSGSQSTTRLSAAVGYFSADVTCDCGLANRRGRFTGLHSARHPGFGTSPLTKGCESVERAHFLACRLTVIAARTVSTTSHLLRESCKFPGVRSVRVEQGR